MVQTTSTLDVADNSGAKKVMCIRVLGGTRRKYASLGDIIVVSIKEAIPNAKVKKGEVAKAVIVRTKKEVSRQDGSFVLGATGGYLVGFLAAAAITGRLAEMGWDRNTLGAIAAMLIGNVAIYLVGVPWLAVALGVDLPTAIALGLTPFIVIDAIKLLAAAGTFRASWWVVGRRTGER